MNYYKIDWDYDNLKIIGHNPQVTLKEGFNPGPPNGFWEVKPREFPNFIPELELDLHKKAKFTDYLEDYVSFGMIINKKFIEVLKKFNLPPHAFYPIKVYHKGKLLEYYWFHYIIEDFWECLDRDKAKGIIYDDKDEYKVVSEIDLSYDSEEILKIDRALPWHQHMKWEKIVFKPNFPRYDVYEIQTLEFGTVISERLLNALQESGMTGFRTQLYDTIICG